MPPRQDFFRECNEHNVSFQDFEAQFCSRCLQKQCTRSQWGKSRFEDRVNNWEERMFLNPAKLEASDPRFEAISAKRFLTVVPGTASTPSEWVDPRATRTEPVMVSVPVAVVQPLPAPAPVAQPAPDPVMLAPASPTVVQKVAPTLAAPPILQNTSVKPRQMIEGAPKTSPLPVSDPWAPKPSLSPGGQIVKPGAKIKLGGG